MKVLKVGIYLFFHLVLKKMKFFQRSPLQLHLFKLCNFTLHHTPFRNNNHSSPTLYPRILTMTDPIYPSNTDFTE